MKCKICNADTLLFASAKIINKYTIKYFKCSYCGFIQTEEPYWLEEVYTNAIANSDIGLIRRNLTLVQMTNAIITIFFDANSKFLDYGGGYGLFVRMMRDAGYDFYRYDKYCPNLFAQGFDNISEKNNGYQLLTAYELFEHFKHPITEIESILTYSDNILFSTAILPSDIPKPGEWWYYSLETGQHISFYTIKSLKIIADKYGLNLYTNGSSLHLLTKRKLTSLIFQLISKYKIARFINLFTNRKSLLQSDYEKVSKQ